MTYVRVCYDTAFRGTRTAGLILDVLEMVIAHWKFIRDNIEIY